MEKLESAIGKTSLSDCQVKHKVEAVAYLLKRCRATCCFLLFRKKNKPLLRQPTWLVPLQSFLQAIVTLLIVFCYLIACLVQSTP